MSTQEAVELAKLLTSQYGAQECFQVSLGDHASFDLVHAAILDLGCRTLPERDQLMLTVFPGGSRP